MPIVAIVGRPNVGKSLLFNRLCGRRASIVHDQPGMTLDYLTEPMQLAANQSALLSDTGGVYGEENEWSPIIAKRMKIAAAKADVLLIVVDARVGLQRGDSEIIQYCRKNHPTAKRLLLVNKAEGMTTAEANAEFYTLGEEAIAISAKRGSGLAAVKQQLRTVLFDDSAHVLDVVTNTKNNAWPLAIIGRPNVGKSTLMNGLLGQERATVSEVAGTTRDNVRAVLSYKGGECLLIDTAGMRRRRAEMDAEKLSVSAARQALKESAAVLLLYDMTEGIQRQDKRLAAMAAAAGCGVVVVGNKCDLLARTGRQATLKKQVADLQLGFYAQSFAVSALQVTKQVTKGTNASLKSSNKTSHQSRANVKLDKIIEAAAAAAKSSQRTFSTAVLNRALRLSVNDNPPPKSGGVRPKLRYIHQGGQSPLRLIVHGGGVTRINDSYRRYLSAALARHLALLGAPIQLEFRAEENPYVK